MAVTFVREEILDRKQSEDIMEDAIIDMPDDDEDLRAVAHFLEFSQFPDNVGDEAKMKLKKQAMNYCVRKVNYHK